MNESVCVLLLGGTGKRMFPVSLSVNKHFFPLAGRFVAYHSFSIGLYAGLREFILVVNQDDEPVWRKIWGDGSHLGLKISYVIQQAPRGIVDGLSAVISQRKGLLDRRNILLVLGDNLLVGGQIIESLTNLARSPNSIGVSRIFKYFCRDVSRYGSITESDHGEVTISEKSSQGPGWAIPGIYFISHSHLKVVSKVGLSDRNELEITSLLTQISESEGEKLEVIELSKATFWADVGTWSDFYEAEQFLCTLENQSGRSFNLPEEICYRYGYITKEKFIDIVTGMPHGDYRQSLEELLESHEY